MQLLNQQHENSISWWLKIQLSFLADKNLWPLKGTVDWVNFCLLSSTQIRSFWSSSTVTTTVDLSDTLHPQKLSGSWFPVNLATLKDTQEVTFYRKTRDISSQVCTMRTHLSDDRKGLGAAAASLSSLGASGFYNNYCSSQDLALWAWAYQVSPVLHYILTGNVSTCPFFSWFPCKESTGIHSHWGKAFLISCALQ